MIAGAIVCYIAAMGMIAFLPALHAAGGMPASLLQLFGAGPTGEAWIGVVLLALAVLGIVFSAIKKKATVRISAAIGWAGFGAGLALLVFSGITAESLGEDIVALILPLVFIWAAVCNGIYLYMRNKSRTGKETRKRMHS